MEKLHNINKSRRKKIFVAGKGIEGEFGELIKKDFFRRTDKRRFY